MSRIQLGAATLTKAKERRLLWVALGLGLLAFLLNFVFASTVAGKRFQVLRAKETSIAGAKFSLSQFEVISQWGEATQMGKTYLNVADARAYEGKPLATAVRAGELLALHAFNGNGGLPIPPGKRAITIEARNDEKNVGQTLRPGNAVNIWAVYQGQTIQLRGGAYVAAVGNLQNVATNDGREVRYNSVTVFVGADEEAALMTNLNLVGDSVRLTAMDGYDAKFESKALAALNAQPEPTPTPTPTPTSTPTSGPRKRRK